MRLFVVLVLVVGGAFWEYVPRYLFWAGKTVWLSMGLEGAVMNDCLPW